MTKLDNMAAEEFKKLPKKKQKEFNKAKRIPVAKPGHEFNKSDIVNITLHFFLKDVRSMLPPAVNHSISVS